MHTYLRTDFEIHVCMEKKYLIQQQFFDLSRYLNSTNTVNNKIFQTYFYVERVNDKNLLFAAISSWQKISLAQEKSSKFWVRTQNTEYKELEEALALWTPECLKQQDLTKCLKNHIFNP